MDINRYNLQLNLTVKHLISLSLVEPEDIFNIIKLAKELKVKKSVGEAVKSLQGKTIASLTKKSYIAGRIAFLMAVKDLGGDALTIEVPGAEIEEIIADAETLKTLAPLGVDALVVNTAVSTDSELLQKSVAIPVISTTECSTLAMLMTIWESKGKLKDLKFTVIGNFTPDTYSCIIGAIKCGMEVKIISQKEHLPSEEFISSCRPYGEVVICDDICEAVKNADAVCVLKDGDGFIIDEDLLSLASDDVCVFTNNQFRKSTSMTEDLLSTPLISASQHVENLLFIEKAVLTLLLKK